MKPCVPPARYQDAPIELFDREYPFYRPVGSRGVEVALGEKEVW